MCIKAAYRLAPKEDMVQKMYRFKGYKHDIFASVITFIFKVRRTIIRHTLCVTCGLNTHSYKT